MPDVPTTFNTALGPIRNQRRAAASASGRITQLYKSPWKPPTPRRSSDRSLGQRPPSHTPSRLPTPPPSCPVSQMSSPGPLRPPIGQEARAVAQTFVHSPTLARDRAQSSSLRTRMPMWVAQRPRPAASRIQPISSWAPKASEREERQRQAVADRHLVARNGCKQASSSTRIRESLRNDRGRGEVFRRGSTPHLKRAASRRWVDAPVPTSIVPSLNRLDPISQNVPSLAFQSPVPLGGAVRASPIQPGNSPSDTKSCKNLRDRLGKAPSPSSSLVKASPSPSLVELPCTPPPRFVKPRTPSPHLSSPDTSTSTLTPPPTPCLFRIPDEMRIDSVKEERLYRAMLCGDPEMVGSDRDLSQPGDDGETVQLPLIEPEPKWWSDLPDIDMADDTDYYVKKERDGKATNVDKQPGGKRKIAEELRAKVEAIKANVYDLEQVIEKLLSDDE